MDNDGARGEQQPLSGVAQSPVDPGLLVALGPEVADALQRLARIANVEIGGVLDLALLKGWLVAAAVAGEQGAAHGGQGGVLHAAADGRDLIVRVLLDHDSGPVGLRGAAILQDGNEAAAGDLHACGSPAVEQLMLLEGVIRRSGSDQGAQRHEGELREAGGEVGRFLHRVVKGDQDLQGRGSCWSAKAWRQRDIAGSPSTTVRMTDRTGSVTAPASWGWRAFAVNNRSRDGAHFHASD